MSDYQFSINDLLEERKEFFKTWQEQQEKALSNALENINQRFAAQERATELALSADREHAKEVDERYGQRFNAQERAVELALTRVDKEFHEHLAQVREEARIAIAERDKAISKAEIATEKRFESVNEFRSQLSDQARLFMPRAESESKYINTQERIEELSAFHATALTRVEYDRAHVELIQKVDAININLLDKIDNFKENPSIPRSELDSRLAGLEAKIATMIPRSEVAQRMAGIDTNFATINSRLDTREGRDVGSNVSNQIEDIRRQLDLNKDDITAGKGRSAGLKDSWGYIIGLIGITGTIIGIIATIIALIIR